MPPARQARWMVPVLALFALVGLAPVWVKVAHLCFSEYDLGIYAQGLARLGLHTPNPWLPARQVFLFADHFDPVLFLALPAARLLGPRAGGLATEALFVLLSVLPLGWLARRGLLAPRAAAILATLLLLSTGTLTALAFPFHPTTWAMLPWMGLVAGLRARRAPLVLISAVLLLACKEEFPFVLILPALWLLAKGQRRLGAALIGLALAWLGFVFALRPLLVGHTHPYAQQLFAGLLEHPVAYFAERFRNPRLWITLGLTALPFAPLAVAGWRVRVPSARLLLPLAMLTPVVAIRFLGGAWQHHYAAVLVAGVAGVAVFWLEDRAPSRGAVLGSALLLLAADMGPLDAAFRTLAPGLRERNPAQCASDPGRLEALRVTQARVEEAPGPILAQGNLVPAIISRADVFMVLGPSEGPGFRTVWLEKPPSGDPWPTAPGRLGKLMAGWRTQPGIRLLRDDAFVFLAESPVPLAYPTQ